MKIKKEFTMRTVMGQHVVMAEGNNADSYGKLINLNNSAAMLWEALKGKTFTVDDAAALLVSKYGIAPAHAHDDAPHILRLMADKGLVED